MIYPETISNEDLAQLEKAVYHGKIVVVRDEETLNTWLPMLQNDSIVGFDTETKPSFKKGEVNGIALLQLATSKVALLIKIKDVGLPKNLIDFLKNPNILKVGAAIRDDIKLLTKTKRFIPAGFIDLQNMVPNYGITSVSVRKMSGIVLGLKVSKSQQLSNWDLPNLSEAQQQYAAIDAWACQQIYLKLINGATPK
ncbi:MAG: 3'-5' exonuclease domain-containing protein 2 [Bacteroidales bacterium]|jgi:ribonuclease D|nr:3'-5' exonuclease domain-containing protein 2 [Bacteroidales bacterium]MDD4384189.1 3'-5' exonuclease domain-containing protein 2 [Bacteroidales bacterium]MDY0196180.1 3'-5' exonuclease [Tenuifilaceae bacterium]